MAVQGVEIEGSEAKVSKGRRIANAIGMILFALSLVGIMYTIISSSSEATSEQEVLQQIATGYHGVEQAKRGGLKNFGLVITTNGKEVLCSMPSESDLAQKKALVCDSGKLMINAKD